MRAGEEVTMYTMGSDGRYNTFGGKYVAKSSISTANM